MNSDCEEQKTQSNKTNERGERLISQSRSMPKMQGMFSKRDTLQAFLQKSKEDSPPYF